MRGGGWGLDVCREGRSAECGAGPSPGWSAPRLRSLGDEFGPLSRDHRVAELEAEIASLTAP